MVLSVQMIPEVPALIFTFQVVGQMFQVIPSFSLMWLPRCFHILCLLTLTYHFAILFVREVTNTVLGGHMSSSKSGILSLSKEGRGGISVDGKQLQLCE